MSDEVVLTRQEVETRSFISTVYMWMTAGLVTTGLVAGYMAAHPVLIQEMFQTRFVFFGLMIFQLVLVFVLAGLAQRMTSLEAMLVFLAYAGLNGLTLSVIFLAYTQSSIALAFFVTAGTFGVMSLYGYTTKTDLTTLGNICFMGLLGIIVASLVNFFLKSPTMYWITTYLGVLIFVGLTAYDTQKIKNLVVMGDAEEEKKEAIVGALTLYLDFLNLFLEFLRIFGQRREN